MKLKLSTTEGSTVLAVGLGLANAVKHNLLVNTAVHRLSSFISLST